MLDAVLARRTARAHGFQRTGSRIQEQVEQIAHRLFAVTEEAGGTFYWPRGVEEICAPELASLARWVLGNGKAAEEALITMAREMGLLKLRAASRGRLEAALAPKKLSDRQGSNG